MVSIPWEELKVKTPEGKQGQGQGVANKRTTGSGFWLISESDLIQGLFLKWWVGSKEKTTTTTLGTFI